MQQEIIDSFRAAFQQQSQRIRQLEGDVESLFEEIQEASSKLHFALGFGDNPEYELTLAELADEVLDTIGALEREVDDLEARTSPLAQAFENVGPIDHSTFTPMLDTVGFVVVDGPLDDFFAEIESLFDRLES
jgi:hypothetical protein